MKTHYIYVLAIWALVGACRPSPPTELPAPTLFVLPTPGRFGAFQIPADNPMTLEGVALGRALFFDNILSLDGKISCASCHKPSLAFADSSAKSLGISGRIGRRNSMSLANLLWVKRFFWDGRSGSLEDQALHPISDTAEMGLTLPVALERLKASSVYNDKFQRAFGQPPNHTNLAAALAQFIRTLISSNSDYDKYLQGQYQPNQAQLNGMRLFFTHPDPMARLRGGNCGDCHMPISTAGNNLDWLGFHNNGIQTDLSDAQNADFGLENYTNNRADRGKFRTPTLRNIALTAPYMHDGRFANLEQVLDHYNGPALFGRPYVDTLIKAGSNLRFGQSLSLSAQEKKEIIEFLNMLTDKDFVQNPNFKKP